MTDQHETMTDLRARIKELEAKNTFIKENLESQTQRAVRLCVERDTSLACIERLKGLIPTLCIRDATKLRAALEETEPK